MSSPTLPSTRSPCWAQSPPCLPPPSPWCRPTSTVVAYSTVGQLAYMFIGCGVGAYSAGIFHLFTHAFFKALLFLSWLGDPRHAPRAGRPSMGGLKDKMPITYWTFLPRLALHFPAFPDWPAFSVRTRSCSWPLTPNSGPAVCLGHRRTGGLHDRLLPPSASFSSSFTASFAARTISATISTNPRPWSPCR